jgi:hypothetical protein
VPIFSIGYNFFGGLEMRGTTILIPTDHPGLIRPPLGSKDAFLVGETMKKISSLPNENSKKVGLSQRTNGKTFILFLI